MIKRRHFLQSVVNQGFQGFIVDGVKASLLNPNLDCYQKIYRMVRQVLEKQGKKIPRDCSLVCFDYSSDDWEAEGVTCFVHQGYRIGQEAASRLMRMIRNRDCDDINYTYVLAPKIYLGRTVGPAWEKK